MIDLSIYDRVFLLTDEQVAQCCLPVVLDILHASLPTDSRQPSAVDYPTLTLPAGEKHKNLVSVQRIWDFLFQHHATRSSVLINIGGGVICDMGGFAAATYMRGMHYINIPTTLLAMVDAAAGGKTGIDYQPSNGCSGLLKNAVGVFAEPDATIYETALLRSLPKNQVLSGYAEMIKHGLLESPEALGTLLNNDLQDLDSPAFSELLHHSVAFKQQIVSQDLQDRGIRQILNFGHTFGHAIEALLLNRSNASTTILHGYCVMYGMVAEAFLSHALCGLPAEVVSTLSRYMLENYGAAPVTCNDYDELLRLMLHDKKNTEQDTITCTLLRNIGEPVIGQTITPDLLREALEYLCSL